MFRQGQARRRPPELPDDSSRARVREAPSHTARGKIESVTLADILKKWRDPSFNTTPQYRAVTSRVFDVVEELLAEIEADPDFKLRERIGELAKELNGQRGDVGEYISRYYARRIREALSGPDRPRVPVR
jgi:hypothetical protein